MTPKQITQEKLANTIIKNLEKRRMEGYYCLDKESAVRKVLELIPEGSSIGWGGSSTLTEAGVMDALEERKGCYHLIDRKAGKTPEETKQLNTEIFNSDYYLMSTNAITFDGKLVNIDGFANRVGMLCFGPEHVIIVAGMNKAVVDEAAALNRARNTAAAINSVRLERNTPCAHTGHCGDCLSPDCICAQTVITRMSLVPGRIKVILVGEELGF